MEKKKLMVNTGSCDMRKVTEKQLEGYEEITVNAATVYTSPRAKELIAEYPVTINAAKIMEVDEDAVIQTQNGSMEIGPGDAEGEKCLLLVNGRLTVLPGAEKALERYSAISVNGTLLCPESLISKLRGLSVNGSTEAYPDGAVVLKKNTAIDRVFALRAKNSLYWAPRRLLFLDMTMDAAALEAKGARFDTKEAVVAESLVEKVVGMISERAQITIVPDGTAFVNDDAKLDPALLRRFGTKLYINGDLTLDKTGAEAIPAVEYLKVNGDVSLPSELEEPFSAVKAEYNELKIIRPCDKTISDRPAFKVDKATLEHCKGGLLVKDCAAVVIAEDIPAEMILERLSILDCAAVKCSKEQESAVGLIAEDCASIKAGSTTDDGGDFSLKGMFGMLKDTKMINAADYTF